MSKFSECKVSNCIITGNENFLARKGINLFDAVVVTVEGQKENAVKYYQSSLNKSTYCKDFGYSQIWTKFGRNI